MSDQPALNVQQVADRLGCHVNTIKKIPPEMLPFFRIGTRGDRRYDPADLKAYVVARRVVR